MSAQNVHNYKIVRDKLIKDKNYYDRFLRTKEGLIEQSLDRINSNSIPNDNISNVWHRIFFKKFECLIAKYGRGDNLDELRSELDKLFNHIEAEWQNDAVKFKMGRPQKVLDQYWLNSYCYMVWLISLSILLGISKERITQITNLIESANIKDELILYLLSSLNGKGYENQHVVKYALFKNLMKPGIEQIDSQILKKYLGSWHKNTKLFTWHNYINSVNDKEYYFGYWSFESAAIVVLKNLNDGAFNEHPNYPNELVEYYNNERKNG